MLDLRHSYCTRCHSRIGSPVGLQLYSWCEQCRDTVRATSCKAPYWTVAATAFLAISWPMV